MLKIFKNNLSRAVSVILMLVIISASIPFFSAITTKGERAEYGYITGGSFETDVFWADGRVKSAEAFDGDYIVKGQSDSAYVYSKSVSLEKKVNYTFRFWYRNPTADSNDKVAVFYNLNGSYRRIKSVELEKAEEWTLGSFVFTHSAYSDFYFGVQGSDVEIDAVSIPETSAKSAKNILSNGSFENEEEKSWNTVGDGEVVLKGNGVDGFVAAQLPSGKDSGIYFDFPTEKETYYTVTFKYKGSGADASWAIARVRDEIGKNDIIGEKHSLEVSEDWKTESYTFSSMYRTEHRLIILTGEGGELTVDGVCVSLDDTDNLIINGGFEDGFNNWKKNTGSQTIVSAPVNSGEKALKQPTAKYSKVWQAVDVEPNTRYQISFAYTFSTESAATSWLHWSVCDASGDSQSGFSPAINATDNGYIAGESHVINDPNWNNFVFTLDSGSYTRIAIAFQTASSNPAYFDDVVIKKVNVPAKTESILKNPGFESGTADWQQTTDSVVYTKGSVASSGTGSLTMTDHTYYPKIHQAFKVEKGERYIAIFSSYGQMGSSRWAVTKAFDADGAPLVTVEPSNAGSGYITGGNIGSSENWKTVISDIFTPAEDDTYRITFQAHDCKKDSAFIDDVIIFKINDAGSKLINGDFSLGEIAWAFDSEYFEFTDENYGVDGYGMNVLAGNHKTLSQSFKTEKNTNYEISFYYKGEFDEEMSAYCISKDNTFDFESAVTKGVLQNSDTWRKHSFVVNSGNYTSLYLIFQTMNDSQYYIDDIKVLQTDKAADTLGDQTRAYFVDYHNATPYNDYPYITDAANNLFADGGFEKGTSFVGDGSEIRSDSTAFKGDNYLHFEAGSTENAAYITLPLKKNTTYYATLFTRYPETDGAKFGNSHISFGFADPDTEDFILTSNPDSETGRMYTETTQCSPAAADNEWHIISFSIKSNDAQSLKFLIRGTNDTIDIDELYIFEEKDAVKYVSDFEKKADVTITDLNPKLLGTKTADDNLVGDFDFENGYKYWTVTDSTLLGTAQNDGDLNAVNSRHSIQKNALLYESTKRYPNKIYYIRWIDVEPNTEYTFSAKCALTKTGGGAVGIISGYRSDGYSDVTENMKLPTVIKRFTFGNENFIDNCDWQSFGVSFNTNDRNRVGIMVYDGGGTAYFDDFRLFKTADAAKLTEPVSTFPKTLAASKKAYKLSGGLLTGVDKNTAIKTLLGGLKNSKYIRVFAADGSEITDFGGYIGTGMQVRLMDGPVIKDRATVIIYGDVTGDGKADGKDSTAILKHLSETELLTGNYLKAADVDRDGKVTVYDSRLSSKSAKTGSASFRVEGPTSFAVGDEIRVVLVCDTDNITALNGRITLTSGLIFLDAKADKKGSEFYFTEQDKDIVFSFAPGSGKLKKGETVVTFTLQVGNIARYSDAAVTLSDTFATTGKDLLKADSYRWTNVTVKGEEEDNSEIIITEETTETLLSTRLSLLKLDEAEISPEFDPEIKEYTATVPYKIDKVTVTAVPEYENAVVTVGDSNLEYVGNNIVKVLVETENGGRRTYKITVKREAPEKKATADSGLPLWAITAIIAGAILLLAVIAAVVIILIKRKKKTA